VPAETLPEDLVNRIATGFVRQLRAAGLAVPVGSAIMFVKALGLVGVDRRAAVYWSGRATLVRNPEDIPVFDRVFEAYWRGRVEPPAEEPVVEHITLAVDDEDALPEADDESPESGPTLVMRYSPQELLRERDFALYTDAELREAQDLMSRMRLAASLRPSRRRVSTHRERGHPDLRRTVRRALRTDGEPLKRAFTEKGEQPRRLVLLLDVSGSMETYARALVRFVHVSVVARRRVEAFAMGTRLTRITRELSTRDPDAAVAKAADRVMDWSGGTRLGESLEAFNNEWGIRGMARGAVVVILSDGWDRGDPELLAEQMERLHRVAHRVVWVNPLKASPGYAPLAQGMAAALPHVDTFIEGHSLQSLENLAAEIAA